MKVQPVIGMDFSRLPFKYRLQLMFAVLFGKYIFSYGPHIMRIAIPDTIRPLEKETVLQ